MSESGSNGFAVVKTAGWAGAGLTTRFGSAKGTSGDAGGGGVRVGSAVLRGAIATLLISGDGEAGGGLFGETDRDDIVGTRSDHFVVQRPSWPEQHEDEADGAGEIC